ncbi:indole-3-glycerol phosphate synthase TrpC [Marivirga arenosa]|uniref:indole-3-glycerol-phosphate synthase n=1 Tax=Marivirga arenosa TaxID=3059076 RepID=A0AA49JBF4_9BACT|nr:indole-3-glycerol phosphate synthase TrpC [Marivirga sp. ABR2-2]WKK87410.1 indole-3-glycerol phosphate synthase TrpC [Marivirga sp. ABR2-2]
MNILEQIAEYKKEEVKERQKLFPVEFLKQKLYYKTKPVSLKSYILDETKSGIIAEIKRKSPSEGVINPNISVEEVSIGYMQSGSSALSVLTDEPSFGGSLKDLETARKYNYCPILRKDFMLDPYQVYEAKAHGADAILLIAAMIDKTQCQELASLAHELGMEVLLEVHNHAELNSHFGNYADLVGINSRDLKSFNTNLEVAKELADQLPNDVPKIAESGLKTPEDVLRMKVAGFDGFLIGTTFMKSSQPAKACQRFSQQVKNLITNQGEVA